MDIPRCDMGSIWDAIWVRILPKRLLTALVGALAARPMSRRIIPWFVRHYGIDVTEAERPLDTYQTWIEFFARRLRPGVRTVAQAGVVSPVDGRASAHGAIVGETLVQAKGHVYQLSELVAGTDRAHRFSGGQYVTFYLSPRDYHRVHMPVSGEIVRWTHVPGQLYPVNPAGVRSIRGLFAKNERLIVELESEIGPCALVLVGATIVGSIRTSFGPVAANPFRRRQFGIQSEAVSIRLHRGDELGYFAFGSTVICLFPRHPTLHFRIGEGDCVQMGEVVADLGDAGKRRLRFPSRSPSGEGN